MNEDDLLDQLERVLNERAPLHALHGPFGTFEHTRKILLAQIRSYERVIAVEQGKRPTNDQLDDLARMDQTYVDLIDRATKERTRLAELEAQMTLLEHRLSYGKAKRYENAQLARMQ